MGMFDKDKEIGTIITSWIPLNQPFVLWNARITHDGTYPTKMGLASQATLEVSRTETPGDRYDVTTLASAICSKVRDAESNDFPAVVQLAKVPSPTFGGEALVLQFLKPWGEIPDNPQSSPPSLVGVPNPPF